jgi:hypothetical protein
MKAWILAGLTILMFTACSGDSGPANAPGESKCDCMKNPVKTLERADLRISEATPVMNELQSDENAGALVREFPFTLDSARRVRLGTKIESREGCRKTDATEIRFYVTVGGQGDRIELPTDGLEVPAGKHTLAAALTNHGQCDHLDLEFSVTAEAITDPSPSPSPTVTALPGLLTCEGSDDLDPVLKVEIRTTPALQLTSTAPGREPRVEWGPNVICGRTQSHEISCVDEVKTGPLRTQNANCDWFPGGTGSSPQFAGSASFDLGMETLSGSFFCQGALVELGRVGGRLELKNCH